jgi:RNA polymerase sigma factor (sigma-70 family)
MSVDPATALPSRPSPGAAGARLGELYAEHARMVYGICRMLLRDPNEAEDATQQVFLAAYTNLLTGTEVRDPAAWLATIARNACRRRATVRMREPLPVDEEPTLVSAAADETAIGREEAAALYAQLAELPAKQREAVVLRDMYGLRYDEVAKALGTTRPAVEALLFRGRRRLQHRLRPGVAAGVLVVPLAIQESIAYAVPGFAATAAPAGAMAVAAGIPLLTKLAAAGAAVGIAGSAGVVAERSIHDAPTRPAGAAIVQSEPPGGSAGPAALLSVPPGGFPIAPSTRADGAGTPEAEDEESDGDETADKAEDRADEEHERADEADDREDEADEDEEAEDEGLRASDDEDGPDEAQDDQDEAKGRSVGAENRDAENRDEIDGGEPDQADADDELPGEASDAD